jgi:hypothetical protein
VSADLLLSLLIEANSDLALLDLLLQPVRPEMLERTLGEQALRRIRELSWSLKDKLHLAMTQLELSRPAQKPMATSAAPGFLERDAGNGPSRNLRILRTNLPIGRLELLDEVHSEVTCLPYLTPSLPIT